MKLFTYASCAQEMLKKKCAKYAIWHTRIICMGPQLKSKCNVSCQQVKI